MVLSLDFTASPQLQETWWAWVTRRCHPLMIGSPDACHCVSLAARFTCGLVTSLPGSNWVAARRYCLLPVWVFQKEKGSADVSRLPLAGTSVCAAQFRLAHQLLLLASDWPTKCHCSFPIGPRGAAAYFILDRRAQSNASDWPTSRCCSCPIGSPGTASRIWIGSLTKHSCLLVFGSLGVFVLGVMLLAFSIGSLVVIVRFLLGHAGSPGAAARLWLAHQPRLPTCQNESVGRGSTYQSRVFRRLVWTRNVSAAGRIEKGGGSLLGFEMWFEVWGLKLKVQR